jgi:hypothetical protein
MDSRSKGLYYRCYFTINDRIVAHEAINCADDAAAIEKARALLAGTSYLSLEVWRGAACVAKLEKDESTSSEGGVSNVARFRNR